jgi:predicted alpha-1,2-mannosidase
MPTPKFVVFIAEWRISMSLLQYVNPLQGTDSYYHYSNGNTLPYVTLPFGMASWSPQTNEEGGGWYFHPSHRHLQGIRLTHQPSPWIGDYGNMVIMPQTGKLCLKTADRASSFKSKDLIIKPDYLAVTLLRDQTTLELTPTLRCAYLRILFSRKDNSRLILSSFDGETSIMFDYINRRVTGYTRANKGGVPNNFAMYFVFQFDCNIDMQHSGIYNKSFEIVGNEASTGDKLGAFVGLSPEDEGVVTVRIATSFISLDQAQRNLDNEIGEGSFDTVRKEASKIWEKILSTIQIESDEERQRCTFYSCFYRTCLFPRIMYEYNELGKQIHYSPFSGKIHSGPMYADNGFWDTYKTVYPLYSILFPSLLNEMLEAWTNAYKEGGWMPRWVSPGERNSMPGTLIDAVFADAYVKGVRNYDVETAYEGLLKHATQVSQNSFYGRKGLEYYDKLGYIPCDVQEESVSNTLDYVYGDFCISQIAKDLGTNEEYQFLRNRADNYKKLYNKESGFMQGKKEDGTWKSPFNPFEWGNEFCEGSAWQCGWAVQHDLRGLSDLVGGKEEFKNRLTELMNMPPVFSIGSYPCEIHEMSEMAATDLGQFAISNQPSFHIPYMFAAIGCPELTQYWVRKTLEENYSHEIDGLPGDEDNGSLCSWYLFGAMGIYPLCPGTSEYVIGSPLFKHMTINLENGKKLVIEAGNNSLASKYVERLQLNNETHERLVISHNQIISGGHLHFKMSDIPVIREYQETDLPFSMSKGESIK